VPGPLSNTHSAGVEPAWREERRPEVSVADRLDAFQRAHRVAAFPLAVVYKFIDDQGSYLSALITYYAFLGLFPLLLLASSILGFVLHNDPHLQHQILNSALSQFPVIGDQLGSPGGLQGSKTAVVVGILGSLYGALGVANATQNAMNIAWGVPRNKRPNPIVARLRSMLLLLTAGVGILATTLLSSLGSEVDAFNTQIGTGLQLIRSVAAILLNAGVFVLLYRLATTHPHSLKRAVPGALFAAVTWQLLQLVGTAYVGHVIKNATVTNSVFALVLGLIAWIYLGAVIVVLGVEINVVKAHRLYPRALMTPFTDNVDLTAGDQRAYSDYAEATRSKDFEQVDVSFEHDGQYATAKRRAERDNPDGSDDPLPPSTKGTGTRPEKPHKHY
jgi:membrane protein